MRITIGGVLLFVGAGAVATVAFLPSGTAPAGLENAIVSIREKVNTSLGLFRSASVESPNGSLPLATPVQDVPVPEPVATIPVAVLPVPAVTPVAEVEVKTPIKKSTARRSRRRKPVKKKVVAEKHLSLGKPAVAAQPAAAKPAAKTGGSLIGSDVVLTLTTGRDVRGVLQEQDAIAYKVELPGLGIFTYPIQNVKTIRAAE
jgi:hypothetical protein